MAIVGIAGYFCFIQGGFDGLGYYRDRGRSEYSGYFENSFPEWRYTSKTGLLEKFRNECNFYDLQQYRMGRSTNIPRPGIDSSCFEKNTTFSKFVFIWGDSHAQALNFGLRNHLPPNWQILQVASSGCRPNANAKEASTTSYCDQSNWFALKAISESKPDVVILAQNLGHNIAGNNYRVRLVMAFHNILDQ